MKKVLMIIVGVLLTVAVSAQTEKVKQRVELKNGSEIIGYVAEQNDGSYLVETESGDMFFYSASEIKKIVEIDDVKVKTVKLKEKTVENSDSIVPYRSKGYMGMVSGTFGTDFGVSVINGYRFSPHFYLGLGVGVGTGLITETIHTPEFYLYLMSEFSKKRVAMFADFSYGFYFDPWEGVDSQATITLGVRNRLRKNPNMAMWWGLNFGVRGYSYSWDGYYQSGVVPIVSAKIAFSF